MNKIQISLIAIVFILQNIFGNLSLGLTASDGKIHKETSFQNYETESLYEFGLNTNYEYHNLYPSARIESGWYNLNPSFGIETEINGIYPGSKSKVSVLLSVSLI